MIVHIELAKAMVADARRIQEDVTRGTDVLPAGVLNYKVHMLNEIRHLGQKLLMDAALTDDYTMDAVVAIIKEMP